MASIESAFKFDGDIAMTLLAATARKYYSELTIPMADPSQFVIAGPFPESLAETLVTDFMTRYHQEIFSALSERQYRDLMDSNEELPF